MKENEGKIEHIKGIQKKIERTPRKIRRKLKARNRKGIQKDIMAHKQNSKKNNIK